VVEDDKAVRKMITSALIQCGYRVQEAGNAAEALPLIQGGVPFDLVITDIIMPQMSGKDLYDRVKTIRPGLKVLFISGYTDYVLAQSVVLNEGTSFLEKPFTPIRLARKIREVPDGVSEKPTHERQIVQPD